MKDYDERWDDDYQTDEERWAEYEAAMAEKADYDRERDYDFEMEDR